jgi:citrate lyase subunit beta/citryl-CoA lyase
MDLPVTYLFVPGDRPERFGKALVSGADRVILDLEDAVRPDAKAAARAAIVAADVDWTRIAVRVNPMDSAHRAADVEVLRAVPCGAVLVPKAEAADELVRLRAEAGRAIEVIPQVETARGLASLGDLLAVEGVRRAAFGHLDFALDLGCAPDWDALAHARSQLVLATRLAGAQAPIDSVTTDIADLEGLAAEAATARRFGFGGKLLIHPSQVGPVRDAFRPSQADVDWATRVLAALAEGSGAVALDGKMIDRPVEQAARRILARAGR